MKPTLPTRHLSKETDLLPVARTRFPLTDRNYHTTTLLDFRGGCASPRRPSFRNISREYFRRETGGVFIVELIAFIAMAVTALIPIVSNLQELAAFLRAIGTL